MKSILDVNCSAVAHGEATITKTVNLLKWLTIPQSKFVTQQERVRAETDQEARRLLKRTTVAALLPCGTFSKRAGKDLVKHSGFIAIDFDQQHNLHIRNFRALKREFSKLPNVAYCGLSVSGQGYWILIPIAHPEKHLLHFNFIQSFFKSKNIVVDKSCSDISRLRYYSYDPKAYFNHAAKTLQSWQDREPTKSNFKANEGLRTSEDVITKVGILVNEICRREIDLTTGDGTEGEVYKCWFDIGCSFANEFGDEGREYFHSVSQFHPDYNFEQTDRQFTDCLTHNYSAITIATFLGICRDAGIRFDAALDFAEMSTPIEQLNECPQTPIEIIAKPFNEPSNVKPCLDIYVNWTISNKWIDRFRNIISSMN